MAPGAQHGDTPALPETSVVSLQCPLSLLSAWQAILGHSSEQPNFFSLLVLDDLRFPNQPPRFLLLLNETGSDHVAQDNLRHNHPVSAS